LADVCILQGSEQQDYLLPFMPFYYSLDVLDFCLFLIYIHFMVAELVFGDIDFFIFYFRNYKTVKCSYNVVFY